MSRIFINIKTDNFVAMYTKSFFLTLCLVFGTCITVAAQKSYNALMHEGNELFDAKKYDQAAAKYAEATKANEKDFAAHYNLGNALYKSQKYEEAKAEYEKASALSGSLLDKAASLHNLGNSYMKMNQPEKAAEFYKQSLKQDPYSEPTRKNYEIAKLKEQENQQHNQNQQNDQGGGGNDKKEDGNQGEQKSEQQNKQQQGGSGEKEQQGQSPEDSDNNDRQRSMPKGMEDAILNRASEKERETARRILNNENYSMPESNEKDW